MSEEIKDFLTNRVRGYNSNNKFYDKSEINHSGNKYLSYDIINENEEIKNSSKENNNNYKTYILKEINKEINNETNNEDNKENINQNNSENSTEVNNDKNNEAEDELPLITLNFISNCQCCKNKFDKEKCIPYLLKCGHFFCIDCIKQYFTSESGVVCPLDGPVAKSIEDLKLLKNLIPDSKTKNKNIISKMNYLELENDNTNTNNNINNYCPIHKNQKLTHMIKDTNEVICVHCAFDRLKANSNAQIIEIQDKFCEYNEVIENIINNSQKNIELINHTLELINKNKDNEIKKLNIFINNMIKFIDEIKKEKTEQIQSISNENTHELEQKLLIFNEIIEQGEEFKRVIEKENIDNYVNVLNNYHSILKLNKSNNEDNLNNKLKYIKLSIEKEANIKEYLSKICNLSIMHRKMKYLKNEKIILKDNIKEQIKPNDEVNDTDLISFDKYKTNLPNKKINLNFYHNIKNSSCENIYNNDQDKTKIKNINNDLKSKDNYSSINIKEVNSIYHKHLNNHMLKFHSYKKNHNQNNIDTSNIKRKKESYPQELFLRKKIGEKYINKKSNREKKHNSLLDSYLEMKNQNNSISLNYYDTRMNSGKKKNESQKNSKSFNKLNALNNFYNLNYTKRSLNNKYKKNNCMSQLNINNNYNSNEIRLCKPSLNKAISKYFNRFNKTYSVQ